MRRSVVLFFFAALTESVLAQQPTCRTILDLPCYTIRMSHRQWQIFMNGSAEIVMFTDASIAALRSDDSRVVVGDSSSWQLLGTRSNHKGSWLYLAPENEIVTVDDTNQTIARREPLIWHDLPYRRSVPNDSTCRSGILHFGTDFNMKGTFTVAGVAVVRWYRTLGNGGYEEEYLAPSLDCIPLKMYSIRRNALWLPTFINSSEATSVEFGEPVADLFTLPPGYRQVEDPRRAELLKRRGSN